MPKSALPEHLQDIDNNFPDDSQYGTSTLFGRLYKWYHKKTKTWFAFSYRCKERWARWRRYPAVLFAVCGGGPWRYESNFGIWIRGGGVLVFDNGYAKFNWDTPYGYMSRIQPYSRWHVAIQWPLMISFHWYPKKRDVLRPEEPLSNADGKAVVGYWGHYDADNVYWMFTSVYVGLNCK